MESLLQRTSLLYGTFAFALLFALIVAGVVIAASEIDRRIAADLESVASDVPAIAARAPDADFSLRAAYIIAHARRPGVEISVRDTSVKERNSVSVDFWSGGSLSDNRPGPGAAAQTGLRKPQQGDPSYPWLPRATAALFSTPSERLTLPNAIVDVFPSAGRLDRIAALVLMAVCGALILCVMIALVTGRWIAVRALAPLREVVTELYRFGSGDFSERSIDDFSRSDYGELTLAYNAATRQVARALGERAQAEAEMRQFIADAAHELRTPLTVVDGYVQLLRSGIDRALQVKALETIASENRRMRDLIGKLLALTRLDSPQVSSPRAVNLASIVEAALDEVPFLSESNDVRLDIRTSPVILCEPGAMKEAVANLLVNATKYARGSAVEVGVRIENGKALLEICDDGPGMSAMDRDNAFRRFYRGEFVRDIEGSGLGLSIVERVVSRANGSIALDTAPGCGTRFAIELPLVREAKIGAASG